MTDNEIIKALDHCKNGTNCRCCPYFKCSARCVNDAMGDALDLINRQKEEIAELKSKCDSLRMAGNSLKMHLKNAEAEIERLREMASKIEYMHNFQLERSDIVQYVYQTHEILKILKGYGKGVKEDG